ncbi:MAG: hypothetical protein IJI54_13600 [Kiritimatiellae bacterium]|nr:hypothetical protein [Kiritimatiellia bacterium]
MMLKTVIHASSISMTMKRSLHCCRNDGRDGTVRIVQVAWTLNADNEKREIQGAVRAMDRFGIDRSVLLTHSQSDLVNVGGRTIKVVPSHEYLA